MKKTFICFVSFLLVLGLGFHMSCKKTSSGNTKGSSFVFIIGPNSDLGWANDLDFFSKNWTFIPRLGELEKPVMLCFGKGATLDDAIPLVRKLRSYGVKEIGFAFSNIKVEELRKAHNESYCADTDGFGSGNTPSEKLFRLSHIEDIRILPLFNYSSGKLPITVDNNIFIYNEDGMPLPERKGRSNKHPTIACYLRFWDNSEALRREVSTLSQQETRDVLAELQKNAINEAFPYPIYVRESWTGNERYVIEAYGKKIVVCTSGTCVGERVGSDGVIQKAPFKTGEE